MINLPLVQKMELLLDEIHICAFPLSDKIVMTGPLMYIGSKEEDYE